MAETPDFMEVVANSREKYLQDLISLASEGRTPSDAETYRERALRVRAEFDKADKMLREALPAINAKRFAHFTQPVDAIEAYLKEVGRPVPVKEVIIEVPRGGLLGGGQNIEDRVKRSLSSFASPTAAGYNSVRVKVRNGMVGLRDWEESRFVSQK